MFLGALVVPYLDDGLRCASMYLISFVFLAAGLALSLRRRSQFSLAVLGTGAGALFISVLMTHLHFGFLGGLETFALLLVWTAACMALVKRFDSLLLSIVAHVGMIVSVCFAYGAGFDDTRAAAVIVYQLLASALVVGGSALCFRRTYRFGLFASLGLTVVASLFMWERFGATLSVGFSSSLPDAAIVAAFSLQFAAASVLSVFLSVSASRLESPASRFAVHTASFVLWVAALFANVYWTAWKCASQVVFAGLGDRVLDGLGAAPGIYHVAGGLDVAVAYALRDARYGVVGNVALGLEMLYLLAKGYGELARVGAFLEACAMLLVLGALFWWWRGLPQPAQSRRAMPAALVGLVFFELSVSWFAGREFPYLSDAVSSFVLVSSVLAFYLAGFQRLSQEGSGWWVAAWVNELVALLAAASAIGENKATLEPSGRVRYRLSRCTRRLPRWHSQSLRCAFALFPGRGSGRLPCCRSSRASCSRRCAWPS